LADICGPVWVGKASSYDLCWAFLAAVDELRESYEKDSTRLPILTSVARSGYIQVAHKLTKVNYSIFMDRCHRVEIANFNPKTDVGYNEYAVPLSDASVWTLMKALSGQMRAGVNRFYPRYLADRPLADFPKPVKNTKNVKANTKASEVLNTSKK